KGERLLDLFLSQGIDLSIFKNEIYNPLLHIASRGEKKVLIKFIEAGIDIDPVNSDGYSPLMWLIKIGEYEMAETFLQLGANPERKTKSGLTAYDLARTTRRIPMLKLLERYGVEK
ncbi:MAG: ankyrin repeat domain-containing protein, partial [Firmicutes bacterium]|nr:ankyrin repeat domain-containing protein [Bacillota bacterium]